MSYEVNAQMFMHARRNTENILWTRIWMREHDFSASVSSLCLFTHTNTIVLYSMGIGGIDLINILKYFYTVFLKRSFKS